MYICKGRYIKISYTCTSTNYNQLTPVHRWSRTNVSITVSTESSLEKVISWTSTSWSDRWTVENRTLLERLTRTTHGKVLASGTHVTGRASFSTATRHCVVIDSVGNSCAAWILLSTARSLSIGWNMTKEPGWTVCVSWVLSQAHTSSGQMTSMVAFIILVVGIWSSSQICRRHLDKTNGEES